MQCESYVGTTSISHTTTFRRELRLTDRRTCSSIVQYETKIAVFKVRAKNKGVDDAYFYFSSKNIFVCLNRCSQTCKTIQSHLSFHCLQHFQQFFIYANKNYSAASLKTNILIWNTLYRYCMIYFCTYFSKLHGKYNIYNITYLFFENSLKYFQCSLFFTK